MGPKDHDTNDQGGEGEEQDGSCRQVFDSACFRIVIRLFEVYQFLYGGIETFCRQHHANAQYEPEPVAVRHVKVQAQKDHHRGCDQVNSEIVFFSDQQPDASESIPEAAQALFDGKRLWHGAKLSSSFSS